MKLNFKNKIMLNNSIKRSSSNNSNDSKKLGIIPIFVAKNKKSKNHSKTQKESTLKQKNKEIQINNNIYCTSSLFINYMTPMNKSIDNSLFKKDLSNNEFINNKIIITTFDNSSKIGSKGKKAEKTQKNNNAQFYDKKKININNLNLKKIVTINNKNNSKYKRYPVTSLNSPINSLDKKNNTKKNSKLNKRIDKKIKLNKNIKGMIGFSNLNNYIRNSKLQKITSKNNNISQNTAKMLFSGKKSPNKNIINNSEITSKTTKVSPRISLLNTNSKSIKAFNDINRKEQKKFYSNLINNKLKINEIIKNNNRVKKNIKSNINHFFTNIKTPNNDKVNYNIIYNSFNNIYYFPLNNNKNHININSYSNFENLVNNCPTTQGILTNNCNINNQANNKINNNNSDSKKRINSKNVIINDKKISQSQGEMKQIKKRVKKYYTSNNSPEKKFKYIIIQRKKNKSNNKDKMKNNNILSPFNNLTCESNNRKNKSNLNNQKNNCKKKKIGFYGFRNKEKYNSKSTEKIFKKLKIKSLKNRLKINEKGDLKFFKNSNKNIKSYLQINIYNKGYKNKQIKKIKNNNEVTKTNKFMEDSLKLSNYIKDYYKKNHEYPSTQLNFYKYGRIIGQGAFGKVNLGLNVLTGRVVAIKSFNKKKLSLSNKEIMKKIMCETKLMKKLNHPNITKILEMFEDEEYILIIMEYINGGNLFSFVKKRRKLTEKISIFLFRQIILGIKHIHSQGIVHRDIKLENILIDLNNTIKICDFGISRILSSPNDLLFEQSGTPMYMAPEIFLCSKEKGYKGFPVDIWSAGIALYIMLSGTFPFMIKNNTDSFFDPNSNIKKNIAIKNIIINKKPKPIEDISDNANDLLKGLLNKDPNKRLTIDEILKHPWLNNEEINAKNANKYHLFTKAEKVIFSKTYKDYRNLNMEDIEESFSISNLKRDNYNNKKNNNSTKSFILTPYNSLFFSEKGSIEDIEKYIDSQFDDFNNININLENDLIVFNNKVKEYNIIYEINNNKEVDNGMIINTKNNSIFCSSSNDLINNSIIKTESVFCVEEKRNNDKEAYYEGSEIKVLINNKIKNEDYNEKNQNEIFEKIENLGYDKVYVKKCLKNNVLCHATSIHFLLNSIDLFINLKIIMKI